MSNELIINVTLGETRVARLENGVVAELNIERVNDESVVGNIYKGKVSRVMPGMQAAFVEIGLNRTAFLHAGDVVEKLAGFDLGDDKGKKNNKLKKHKSIESMLQDGAEIIVQVEKEQIGTKGARITSHVSLPGRYLVYMPTLKHVGISRRIENSKERARLRKIVSSIETNGGFIVRTVSEEASEEAIKADAKYLIGLWKEIEEASSGVSVPSLIYSELDVISKIGRDLITRDISRVVVDDEGTVEKLRKFIKRYMPKAKNLIEVYEGGEPIFDSFGIEIEITRALGQKVWLKSGGYIVIERTEALTAIDVNTGKFVGRRNVEDTILKTNLEAVKEIVYQLKLRNIGGIIILQKCFKRRSIFSSSFFIRPLNEKRKIPIIFIQTYFWDIYYNVY